MKRLWAVLLVLCMGAGMSRALPLSAEGKKEAQLFNDFLKASFALRAGDKDAVAQLERLYGQYPSPYLKRLIVQGALEQGDLEKAAAYIDFITPDEDDAEAWLVYGDYLNKTSQWKEALKAFEKAMELEPDDPKYLAGYAEALLHAQKVSEIVSKLEELAERYSTLKPDIYTQIGFVYTSARDWKNALAYYDKALAVNPSFPQARIGKIKVYGENNLFVFVFNELSELEKSGYQSPQMYRQLGLWYMATNNREQAEQYFLKAWDMETGEPLCAAYLADFASRRKDYAQALSYLQQSNDYDKDPNKWLDSAIFLDKMGQKKEALALLKKGYATFPQNVKVGYLYALSLQDNHRSKEAAAVLKHLLETDKPYTDVLLSYAYVLESLKDYDEMEKQIKTLLKINPNHAPALNLLAFSLAQRGIRLDEAEQAATSAVALSPQDISFIDTLAWVYAKAGKWKNAEVSILAIPEETVLKTPELAYHKGYICYYQNKRECAERYLPLAQKEFPEAKKLYKALQKQPR